MNHRIIRSISIATTLMTVALALHSARPANAQDQLWITQFGTDAFDAAWAVASDGSKGVFVGGNTSGSLASPLVGFSDAYLALYDEAGNQLWGRQFGASGSAIIRALASDSLGGVFVGGETEGSLGGPHAGGYDVFLARYNGEGDQVWITQFGTSGLDVSSALVSDDLGGVFVCGSTEGSLGGPNAGFADAFLARYDGAGNRLWIRQFGTTEDDWGTGLASDGAGGVFVSSHFGLPNLVGWETYLAHYDSAGIQIWTRQLGLPNALLSARALAPDGGGGVFVGGVLLGPGPSIWDVFLAHFDNSGNQTWIRQFGTSEIDSAYGLATDGSDGVFISGWTEGSLGGPNAGSFDAFLAHYDNAGDQIWIQQFGTGAFEEASALAPDGCGGVFVGGRTGGSLGGPTAGFVDIFLARYRDACYPDCDQSTGPGVLDLIDFICFGTSFVLGEPYACDCDTSTGPGVCDLIDFICFQSAFVAGCP